MNGLIAPTPWLSAHARFFLPACLPQQFSTDRRSALPRKELPGMPRYRVTWGANYGGVDVAKGTEIAYCGWPTSGLEPLNKEAKLVCAYFAENHEHPRIAPAPWCAFAYGVFLPELPELKPQQRPDVARPAPSHRPVPGVHHRGARRVLPA